MIYPTVSLLITTYNWPEALLACLESVRRQRHLPDEVLIADDGSKNDTRDLVDRIKKDFPVPVIHIWHEDLGYRRAQIINKAVKQSNSEYIVMTDGDIVLHPCFIKDHKKTAQCSYFVQGSRGLLSPKLSKDALQGIRFRFNFLSPGLKNKLNVIRCPAFSKLIKVDPYNSSRLIGCNLACWKADFIKVNGFNNDLEGWGHEDIEFAARMINNGILRKKLKFAAICYHIYHSFLPRDKEDVNMEKYRQTVANKIQRCENGYDQV